MLIKSESIVTAEWKFLPNISSALSNEQIKLKLKNISFKIALGAPNQPTIAEQTQQTIDKIQHNAQQAVQQFNAKVLEVTGSNSNVDLLTRVQTNAETYAKDIKGRLKKNFFFLIFNGKKF